MACWDVVGLEDDKGRKHMRVARIPITMVVALLAATTLVAIAPGASAATPYPGNNCLLTLTKVTALPGDQLTVTATGYPVGAVVTFVLSRPGQGTPPPQSASAPVTLGSATADANGNAVLVFTLPPRISRAGPIGDHGQRPCRWATAIPT